MAAHDLTTEAGVISYLHDSTYRPTSTCTRAERLPEGFGSFVFRVHLPDNAEPPSVIVKHVKGYAARAPQWKLDESRLDFESKALDLLSPPDTQSNARVRTPKLLHYDASHHVLIMEDVGVLPSLKGWLQPGCDSGLSAQIGEVLGPYLAELHNSTAGQTSVLSDFNGNATAKYISGTLYFGGLAAAAEKFGYTDDYFKEAGQAGMQEVQEGKDVLTLGDFWTGNVLVSAPQPGSGTGVDFQLFVVDLELAKPGTAAFDIGQMAAEMYCLATFRDATVGGRLLDAFLRSYKVARQSTVDAAKVAIRIGAHLVVMMPSAWANEASAKQIKKEVQVGASLVKMGWERDVEGLKASIVAPLL